MIIHDNHAYQTAMNKNLFEFLPFSNKFLYTFLLGFEILTLFVGWGWGREQGGGVQC